MEPKFKSAPEAIQAYMFQLEQIAQSKQLTLDELQAKANLYEFGPDESFMIIGLFDSIRALKSVQELTQKDCFIKPLKEGVIMICAGDNPDNSIRYGYMNMPSNHVDDTIRHEMQLVRKQIQRTRNLELLGAMILLLTFIFIAIVALK